MGGGGGGYSAVFRKANTTSFCNSGALMNTKGREKQTERFKASSVSFTYCGYSYLNRDYGKTEGYNQTLICNSNFTNSNE